MEKKNVIIKDKDEFKIIDKVEYIRKKDMNDLIKGLKDEYNEEEIKNFIEYFGNNLLINDSYITSWDISKFLK